MASDEWMRLKGRLSRLDINFLPSAKAMGDYDSEELDRIAAYVVLVHAEIESYLETVCAKASDTAIAKWRTTRASSRTLLALIVFLEKKKQVSSGTSLFSDGRSLIRLVDETYASYGSVIRNNNGIKESNLRRLLLPLGLLEMELDGGLLRALDDLGSKRGKVAHKTRTFGATLALDPVYLRGLVTEIVDLLEAFDEQLRNLSTR